MTKLQYEKKFQMRKIAMMLEISLKRKNNILQGDRATCNNVCPDETHMKVVWSIASDPQSTWTRTHETNSSPLLVDIF